jgi:hypothetical protein
MNSRLQRNGPTSNLETKTMTGGEVVVTTIFSFRPLNPLNHKQVKEERIRNARHLLRGAATFQGDSPKTKKPRISTGAELVGSPDGCPEADLIYPS